MNEDVRKIIVGYFMTDSNNYLSRFEVLKPHFNDISTRSKLLVDLIFSFECSLKALIFLQSTEDEIATYKKIKQHKLENLFKTANRSVLSNIRKFVALQQLDKYSVHVRYTLEANIAFRNPTSHTLGEVYYDTVANPAWIDSVYEQAKDLNTVVKNEYNTKYGSLTTTNFANLDMEAISKCNKIISQFK